MNKDMVDTGRHLADARTAMLHAYVACTERERDRIGAIITQLDELLGDQ